MKEITRKKFDQMRGQIAKTYGVVTVARQFAVTPTIEQRLQDKIVEMDAFLKLINVMTVDDLEGENILGSASGPVSGRTDTSGDKERMPRDVLGMDPFPYKLYKTNSDVFIRYAILDAWAKYKDLGNRYTRYVQERIANDRVTIGWYGTSAAADTDLVANPLMQDVNKGWVQYMREHKAANILTTGEKQAGEIRIGADGDFVNLDHAVAELTEGIPLFLRKDLVALVGSELVGMEKSALYKAIGAKPTEKNVATESLKSFGGLSYSTPNNFPPRGIVITSYDNLSIYSQEGSWRRQIKEKPEKDRIEDYNSRNEGYVVETPEKFVGVEFSKVKIKNAADAWA